MGCGREALPTERDGCLPKWCAGRAPVGNLGACLSNGATYREESVANRTSIGILSVSVWWSSRSTRTLKSQNPRYERVPANIRIGLSFITNHLKGQLTFQRALEG